MSKTVGILTSGDDCPGLNAAIRPIGQIPRQSFAPKSDELDGAFRTRLMAFVGLCRAFRIRPVLMTQPMAVEVTSLAPSWADGPIQSRFNEIIRDVCRQESVTLIDLDQHFRDEVEGWDTTRTMLYDGLHLTDKGSQFYAAKITDQLAPLVEELTSAANVAVK